MVFGWINGVESDCNEEFESSCKLCNNGDMKMQLLVMDGLVMFRVFQKLR